MSKDRPVLRSRPCAGVEIAIWTNKGKKGGSYYSASITKSWKGEDGEFEERSLSLSRDQLAALAIDTNRLFVWMCENPASDEQLA